MTGTRLLPPLLLTVVAAVNLFAAGESYQPLFVVERSSNENVVHYDAKITRNGELDSRQPVVVYWIMAAKGGGRQELNLLERTRAYGLSIERGDSPHSYRVALVSDRRREIRVYQEDGVVRAETEIQGHRAYLHKIFLTLRGGGWFALPQSIELTGTDAVTGEPLRERIAPDR